MIKTALARILELGINQVLRLEPNRFAVLNKHNGKVLKLTITDIQQDFYFICSSERIYLHTEFSDQPDTIISGSVFALLKQTKRTPNFHELIIEGDIEFANDMKILFQHMNINWQEYLSYVIGDFATSRVSNKVQTFKEYLSHFHNRTIEDILDYVHEEKRYLPTREEVEDFYEDIATLRLDLDRLEARVNRLMDKTIK